ncbi:hypothetical protein KI387_015630, partial [Taxus chinensis]
MKGSSPVGDKGKEREFQPPLKLRKMENTRSLYSSRQFTFSAQSSSSSFECTHCTKQGISHDGADDNINIGLDENNIAMSCLARSSRSDNGAALAL